MSVKVAAALLPLLFIAGCSHIPAHPDHRAPSVLPHTFSDMKSAGFWIGRHPLPRRVVLSPQEIEALNAEISDTLKLVHDPLKIGPSYPGKELSRSLMRDLRRFSGERLYRSGRRRAVQGFFREIRKNMDIPSIGENAAVGYGLTVCRTDERLLPTDEVLTASPDDADFDELQNSGLDMGSPVAILHRSKDGEWIYVVSDLSEGWVKSAFVATASQEEIQRYLEVSRRVVVTERGVDIFLDEEMTKYHAFARLGTYLTSNGRETKDAIEITLPARGSDGKLVPGVAYVRREGVHLGYLQYTPETILEEAFKLLDEPYGWGDTNGDPDCSSFIRRVFATVGIMLPRNSAAQGKVGALVASFDPGVPERERERLLIEKGTGGVTIMQLKGHIMLYLGAFDGRPYAIHATWAYRERGFFGDRKRVIGRVAVTDLELGKGSRKGALLERILTVRDIAGK